MKLEQDLLAREMQFWVGNADFFRQHLNDTCLTASKDHAGVQPREAIAANVAQGDSWRSLTIDEKGFLVLGEDAVILTYEASGSRKNGTRYRALVSSGYVRRDGAWKLAFHQQTPLTDH
jgi:hypothetical protein